MHKSLPWEVGLNITANSGQLCQKQLQRPGEQNLAGLGFVPGLQAVGHYLNGSALAHCSLGSSPGSVLCQQKRKCGGDSWHPYILICKAMSITAILNKPDKRTKQKVGRRRISTATAGQGPWRADSFGLSSLLLLFYFYLTFVLF